MAKGIGRRLKLAQIRVRKDIIELSRGDKYAGGLGSEGYAGGYAQALSDIELLLNGVEPNNSRTDKYWELP